MVDIDVHVPWAPDIEVRLPLMIKPVEDKDVSRITPKVLVMHTLLVEGVATAGVGDEVYTGTSGWNMCCSSGCLG